MVGIVLAFEEIGADRCDIVGKRRVIAVDAVDAVALWGWGKLVLMGWGVWKGDGRGLTGGHDFFEVLAGAFEELHWWML